MKPIYSPNSAAQAIADLSRQGLSQLRAGQGSAARDTFGRWVSADPLSADALLGLAHANRMLGLHDPALDAVDRSLALQPRHLGALVLKGDLLDSVGQATAASFYQAVLKCAEQLTPLPLEWRDLVGYARNKCAQYAERFEQKLRTHIDSVAGPKGPPSARFSQSLDLLTGRSQFYRSAPVLYMFPELPTVQFFSREEFPWLSQLEAATDAIRAELLGLMEHEDTFRPYLESDPSRPSLNQEALLNNPDWGASFLWKNGLRIPEIADRCPRTEAALSQIPLVQVPGRSPSVLFSLLRPKAHIPAHHGFVNTRLIVHLPLIAPQGCRFRVGNQTREWEEGKAWVFDDTIEHEAWNLSDQTRVVLLFEVWRPELTPAERRYVSALFESIQQQRGGTDNWGI
jgi:aspartate beta-hydroxylase